MKLSDVDNAQCNMILFLMQFKSMRHNDDEI